jgi:hypothetical protein
MNSVHHASCCKTLDRRLNIAGMSGSNLGALNLAGTHALTLVYCEQSSFESAWGVLS